MSMDLGTQMLIDAINRLTPEQLKEVQALKTEEEREAKLKAILDPSSIRGSVLYVAPATKAVTREIEFLENLAYPTNAKIRCLQEWLWLYAQKHKELIDVAIDGIWGPQTYKAAIQCAEFFDKDYSTTLSSKQAPSEDQFAQFSWVTKPLYSAFHFTYQSKEPLSATQSLIRDLIVKIAQEQLNEGAREIPENQGPWVRAYCFGQDGAPFAWCVGFCIAVIEAAYQTYTGVHGLDKELNKTSLSRTLSCDNLMAQAKAAKAHIDAADTPEPGDIFLVRRTKYDWIHAGFVIDVDIQEGSVMTIEGNTNSAGYRNGYKVAKRSRNGYKNIDFINTAKMLNIS